jgi:hypothetical protein
MGREVNYCVVGSVLMGKGFVSPAIVTAEKHWAMVQRETFGTLLYVMKFNQFAEAVKCQNEVAQLLVVKKIPAEGVRRGLVSDKITCAVRLISLIGMWTYR